MDSMKLHRPTSQHIAAVLTNTRNVELNVDLGLLLQPNTILLLNELKCVKMKNLPCGWFIHFVETKFNVIIRYKTKLRHANSCIIMPS